MTSNESILGTDFKTIFREVIKVLEAIIQFNLHFSYISCNLMMTLTLVLSMILK